MGTLFNQAPRPGIQVDKSDIEDFLEEAAQLAQKFDISVADVIQAWKDIADTSVHQYLQDLLCTYFANKKWMQLH